MVKSIYTVEYIITDRVLKLKKELLVKWVGYKDPAWKLEADVPGKSEQRCGRLALE